MADSQRKTSNLFPQSSFSGKSYGVMANFNTASEDIVFESGQYTFSCDISTEASGGIFKICFTYTDDTQTKTGWVSNLSSNIQLTSYTGKIVKSITITDYNVYTDIVISNIMLNSGSTALPYEPYGWLHSLRKLGTSTDTITTLPADVYADGNNATVGLVGNMTQTSTLTPSSPIQPQETGERTGNLWCASTTDTIVTPSVTAVTTAGTSEFILTRTQTEANSSLNIPCDITLQAGTYTVCVYGLLNYHSRNLDRIALRDSNNVYFQNNILEGEPKTFTFTEETTIKQVLCVFNALSEYTNQLVKVCIISGSTAPSTYIPYGYKIPISSADTTTPVYLGEVQTTRKIKKIKASDITWIDGSTTGYNFYRGNLTIPKLAGGGISTLLSNKYRSVETRNNLSDGDIASYNITTIETIVIRDDRYSSAADWLSANGDTEIWYVLAEPTTGIVNEPLRKIGDYADTVSGITIPTITGKDSFDVLTTLKPSEVSLAYTGWHDATVKEKSRNLFDTSVLADGYHLDTTGLPTQRGIDDRVATLTPIDVSDISAVTLSYLCTVNDNNFMYSIFDANDTLLARVAAKRSGDSIDVSSAAKLYIAFYSNSAVTISSLSQVMLNSGSTALPYEPYWK